MKEVIGTLSGKLDQGMRHVERVLPLGASLTVVGELSKIASYGLNKQGGVTVNGMTFVIGPSKYAWPLSALWFSNLTPRANCSTEFHR